MKARKHLLSLIASAHGSPALQQMMADIVADAADVKTSVVLKEARTHAKASGSNAPVDISGLVEEIYFEPPDRYFVRSEARTEFEPRRERDVVLKLTAAGASSKKNAGENLSQVQQALLEIQNTKSVHYAGPLTVNRVGALNHGESSFLVTREPNFIEPAQGDPGPFMEVIDHICGVGIDPAGANQKLTLLGWFQQWFRAQDNPGAFIQGQILVIAGAAGIGKNRFSFFVGKLGGDRTYEPARIASNFNHELVGSTLETTHDGAFPDNPEDIRDFWLKRKALVANLEHRIEQKYRDARTVPLPGLRCVVTTNLGDESSKVLPQFILESGMEDKVILLRGHAAPAAYPAQGTPEGKIWVERVLASLPAFVWYVRNEFTLPEAMRDVRFGVKSYHHGEIISAIKSNHSDGVLGEALDKFFADRHPVAPGAWSGTATDLLSALRQHDGAFATITKTVAHLGHQLRRLRVQPGWAARMTLQSTWVPPDYNQERRVWTIQPPGDMAAT